MKAEIEKVLIEHGAVSPDYEQQESLVTSLLNILESQLKERDWQFKLTLSRVKTLELEREILLKKFVKWFVKSDYYTPIHNKPINYDEIITCFTKRS